MDIYFRVIKGGRINDVFKIQRGSVIGRGRSDINLMDSKASSSHARIDEQGGDFYYVDLNSTNGSYVNGQRIEDVKLEPGVKITIGRTVLEVISEFDLKKPSAANLSEWRESVYAHLNAMTLPQSPAPLTVFEKLIIIRVTGGSFAGLEWRLGYGPRFLGPASSDLCLPDPQLPDLCLQFFVQDSEIQIEDLQKKTVAPIRGKMNIVLGGNTLEVELETDS